MNCTEHADCGAYIRALVAKWYPAESKGPRRSHDEVALDREAHARAVAARREFNRRKVAEAEERRANEASHV